MNTYRQQSKQPKLPTAQQRIDRFVRDMKDLGYDVYPIYNVNTKYTPIVSVEIWPKRKEAATPAKTSRPRAREAQP